MNSGRATVAAAVGILAGLSLSAAVLRAGDAVDRGNADAERLLYVQSGPIARRLLLSFDALAADVYWMRAIQHYGRDRKSPRQNGRFELLFPLLDLATSLDPEFRIAYRFGAVFLAEPPPSGPGRVDQAVALLRKGLDRNPDRWHYAFDLGFIYYWYGTGSGRGAYDFAAAADWFERAAGMPNAPVWLQQLAAVTRATGGDVTGARRLLQELAVSREEWVRNVAQRGLGQLAAMEAIRRLQRQVDAVAERTGHWPASWAEIEGAARPGIVPLDPTGVPFEYNPVSHRVALSSASSLFPLPRTPGAK